MNLPAILQAARDTAFKVTESVAKTGTYYSVTVGAYSVSTGATSDTTTTYAISARVGVFRREEVDGESIKSGDQKWVISTAELPVHPKGEDYVIDASGARWDIMLINSEPSGSVYIVRARKLVA